MNLLHDNTMHTDPPSNRGRSGRVGAFTLLEALAASAILAIVVLAVGAAVSAGQTTTLIGSTTVLASMAADDLMNEIVSLPYDELTFYDGLNQPAGTITSLGGTAYPESYYSISRTVEVLVDIIDDPETGARIRGTFIRVTTFAFPRTNIMIETFIAEPPIS